MRRCDKSGKFYGLNLIFKNNEKKFYREVEKEKVPVNETPAVNDFKRFWATIWRGEKYFNENAEWIQNVQTDNTNIQD